MVAGFLFPKFLEATTPNLASGATAVRSNPSSRGLFHGASFTSGAKFQVNASGRLINKIGSIQNNWSFFDDYYNQIYLIPAIIEFGSVGSDSRRDLRIWNAYTQPITVNTIAVQNGSGLSLSGIAAGNVLKALEIRPAFVEASAGGTPAINATYTFSFSIGPDKTLPVTGERSRIWDFPINWGDSYTVSHEFLTEVITSRSQREQRIAVRQTARKRLQFGATLIGKNLRRMQRQMSSWNGKIWIVPEYSRHVSISAMIANAATTTVSAIPSWLSAGLSVVLVDGEIAESKIVLSVVGNVVTFVGSSALAWRSGSLLHPGISAILSPSTSSNRVTDEASTITLQFDAMPASENPEPFVPAPFSYKSRELFLTPYNWGEAVSEDFINFQEKVDYNRGPISLFRPVDFSTNELKVVFMGKSSVEAEKLLQFFKRMKGQQGEFYRPSFTNDLRPIGTALTGSKFLRFAGLDNLTYADDKVFKAVYVSSPTGLTCPNTLKAVTKIVDVEGTDTLFEFDDPWAFNVGPNCKISWMTVSRLASDTATFTWHTDSLCDVQFAMRSLQFLPPEI